MKIYYIWLNEREKNGGTKNKKKKKKMKLVKL